MKILCPECGYCIREEKPTNLTATEALEYTKDLAWRLLRMAEKHPTPGETAYQTVLRWIEEKEREVAGINEDWEKSENNP